MNGLHVKALITGLITAVCLVLAGPAAAVQAPGAGDAEVLDSYQVAVERSNEIMMADPSGALALAQAAEGFLEAGDRVSQRQADLARAWWLQSEALARLGRSEESLARALRALEALGPGARADKLYADLLHAAGRATSRLGDYGDSLTYLQRAHEVYADIGETRSQAITLHSIASIYRNAHEYERAVGYYLDAEALYSGDPSIDLALANNLANAYREMGRFSDSLEQFRRARDIAETMGSPVLQVRILNNLAALYTQFDRHADAKLIVDGALAIAEEAGSSEWMRFLWGVRAMASYGQGDLDSAAVEIERTFDGVELAGTPYHFLDFHEAAANIYTARGDYRAAADHLRAFKRLDDEGRNIAASANTALLGAQFDFAAQELEIEQLRTERLQQNLVLSETRARQRLLAALGALAIALALVAIFAVRYRSALERRRMLAKALYTDAETGLPSRAHLVRRFAEAAGHRRTPHGVVALEIERFAHLRAAVGFETTAELVRRLADRLSDAAEGQQPTVIAPGMLGFLTPDADSGALETFAARLQEAANTTVRSGALEIDVIALAGAAIDEDGDRAIRHAALAIGEGRKTKHPVTLFQPGSASEASRNLALMSAMIAATRNGDMDLHYQPKLNLRTGVYDSAEALCRWTDPERGAIAPDQFIPAAEETGRIRDFTEWALERAVADQARFAEAGHDIVVAVNMSGALVGDAGFARRAADIVEPARGKVSFEITETAVIADPERAIANLEMWTEAGIELAIDDYGTGVSSLAYLKTLPARELKLDRSFIHQIATSGRDRLLVKSTIDLAHNLGMEITAEGVEDEEGLNVLRLLGCDMAQGFGLCRPVDHAATVAFLKKQAEANAQSNARQSSPAQTEQARRVR